MVKINDPRGDRSSIVLRSLRAEIVSKKIKKSKSKIFDENKLNLQRIDLQFYEDFLESPEEIKKELIFLWEEVRDLYEELNSKDNELNELTKNLEKEKEISLVLKKEPTLFGP
jgi:hypothetical protein